MIVQIIRMEAYRTTITGIHARLKTEQVRQAFQPV